MRNPSCTCPSSATGKHLQTLRVNRRNLPGIQSRAAKKEEAEGTARGSCRHYPRSHPSAALVTVELSGIPRGIPFFPYEPATAVPPRLPEEKAKLGIDRFDIILVSGDAYIDHPSFGISLLGRVLWDAGFTVGIIAQPDWNGDIDFTALGEPKLSSASHPATSTQW